MRLGIVARGNAPLVVGRPLRRSMRLEPVEIVLDQLVKRGAGDIGELDFRFLARAARRAALGDVLLATAGGLSHLVDGAVAMRRKETAAKRDRSLVDYIAFAIDDELLVTAMRQYNLGNFGGGHANIVAEQACETQDVTYLCSLPAINRLSLILVLSFAQKIKGKTYLGHGNNILETTWLLCGRTCPRSLLRNPSVRVKLQIICGCIRKLFMIESAWRSKYVYK